MVDHPSDSKSFADGPPSRSTLAVALRRKDATDTQPRVVAKGRGAVAEQIVQLAFANGVKVREDASLAEILAAVDLDCEIPLEALAAVAEILTYLYRADRIDLPAGAVSGESLP